MIGLSGNLVCCEASLRAQFDRGGRTGVGTGSNAAEQFGRMGAVDELGTHARTDLTGPDEPERVVQDVGMVRVAADCPCDLVLRPVHGGARVCEFVHDRGDQRGNTCGMRAGGAVARRQGADGTVVVDQQFSPSLKHGRCTRW